MFDVEDVEKFLAELAPCYLAFGRQLGGDAESCGADGGDPPVLRTAAKFLGQAEHFLADATHEAFRCSLRDDCPAFLAGGVMDLPEHHRLADPAGSGEDREQSRCPGTKPQTVFELIKQA